jgi:hypothetical protein
MGMNLEPEMSIELAIATAQQDIVELQEEYKQLHTMVTGNGDPTKGLVWMATLNARLLTDLSSIVEANRQAVIKADGDSLAALQKHETAGHYARGSVWSRLGFEVGKSVTIWIIIGFLAFAVANFHVSIGATPVR